MKTIAPRIHVLLARAADVGVVIRRGPSKSVCTILWNLKTDEFTLGQWLKGRIFERRCDLSPDGKHLIYFAMHGYWKSAVGGSWTAISRTPYLKAITLYPKGDCWNGGGLFIDNGTYWLNNGMLGHREPTITSRLRPDSFEPFPKFGGECPGVYYPRLVRDGWRHAEHIDIDRHNAVDVFDKPLRCGWKLRKFAYSSVNSPVGKGAYWDEHELLHAETNERQVFPDWEWADYDSKRLVWASQGKIFSANLQKDGLATIKELHDFGDMRFQSMKAPY